MTSTSRPVVLVGVELNQPPVVLQHATRIAAQFGAQLVCGFALLPPVVTPTSYGAFGAVAVPADGDEPVAFPDGLREQIARAVPADLEWDVAAGAGPASVVLQSLAEEYDAQVIVVGTRQATLHGAAEEFFRGSVAAQLTHRQQRPVLVVPVRPTPRPEALPWEPTRSRSTT